MAACLKSSRDSMDIGQVLSRKRTGLKPLFRRPNMVSFNWNLEFKYFAGLTKKTGSQQSKPG
jgi:hypothetical protein